MESYTPVIDLDDYISPELLDNELGVVSITNINCLISG
jgi:hypothetical protein